MKIYIASFEGVYVHTYTSMDNGSMIHFHGATRFQQTLQASSSYPVHCGSDSLSLFLPGYLDPHLPWVVLAGIPSFRMHWDRRLPEC